MSDIHRSASYLLLIYAAAWPLQVYQFLPFTGMYLTTAVGVLLAALWLWDVSKTRSLRWPFELVWPLVIMLAVLWVTAWREGGALPVRTTAQVFLFGAVLHFARNRELIKRCITWSVWGAGAAAVAAALVWRDAIPPTAYSTVNPVTLAPAHDLMGGVLTLLIGGVLAHIPRGARVNPVTVRLTAAAVQALALIVCAYVVWGAVTNGFAWNAPAFSRLGLADWAAMVLAAWTVTRVAAKLWVDRQIAFTRMHAFLIGATLLMVAWFTLFDTPVRGGHVYVLGLAAGFVAFRRGPAIATPRHQWIAAPLLALAAVNAHWVDANNPQDPRHYAAEAEADLQAGDYATLDARLAHIERFAPGDGASGYWRAQAFLEQGNAPAAAVQFERVVPPPPGRRFLSPPSETQRTALMVALRDLCSSLEESERQWAYERALAAQGEPDQAIAALATRSRLPVADADTGPHLHEIAAFLIGGPNTCETLEADLKALGSEHLSALLSAWGARWTHAASFPQPVSVAARRTATHVEIAMFTAAASEPVTTRLLLAEPAPSVTEPAQVELQWEHGVSGESINLIATDGKFRQTLAGAYPAAVGGPRIVTTGHTVSGRRLSHVAAILAAQ